MKIVVNGKPNIIERTDALVDVLRRFGIAEDTTGVAVAVNDAVVPRREWASRRFEEGDVVEVIHAVQGG